MNKLFAFLLALFVSNANVYAEITLLKNAGFEDYSQSSFFGVTTTSFDNWTSSGGFEALSPESTDVKEGSVALRTTTKSSKTFSLDQEIDCSDYATNDKFKLRICYKNITDGDATLKLESYWNPDPGKTIAESDIDANLTQTLPFSTEWDSLVIITKKPANAKSLYLRLTVAKGAELLLDDCTFEPYIDTKPYFAVLPEKTNYTFTSRINSDTTLVTLTVRQHNLTKPVHLEMTGTGKAVYTLDKTELTAEEENVTVKFNATEVGKYNATLNITDDESSETSLMNTTINFFGTAIDPTKKPILTISKTEFETFKCKAGEEVRDSFVVSSENCSDDVHVVVEDETGEPWAFGLSDSYFIKNQTDKVIITFAPKKEGTYMAKFKAYTTGVDTIRFSVSGVAEAAAPTPQEVDYDTTFVWDNTKVYTLLNEQFEHADTCRNKVLHTTDWQNVVRVGDRPWWGYVNDTTKMAKITSYYSYESPGTKQMECWLVTPPLDYRNTAKKLFTFRVMGEFMQSDQTAALQVYYIDATNTNDVFYQHIEEVDELIPANDSNYNGQWTDIAIDLDGQSNISDVFYMAFKFTDNGGTNGIVYYVDDVTWGVKSFPSGIKTVSEKDSPATSVRKVLHNGNLNILVGGSRYNTIGQKQ